MWRWLLRAWVVVKPNWGAAIKCSVEKVEWGKSCSRHRSVIIGLPSGECSVNFQKAGFNQQGMFCGVTRSYQCWWPSFPCPTLFFQSSQLFVLKLLNCVGLGFLKFQFLMKHCRHPQCSVYFPYKLWAEKNPEKWLFPLWFRVVFWKPIKSPVFVGVVEQGRGWFIVAFKSYSAVRYSGRFPLELLWKLFDSQYELFHPHSFISSGVKVSKSISWANFYLPDFWAVEILSRENSRRVCVGWHILFSQSNWVLTSLCAYKLLFWA